MFFTALRPLSEMMGKYNGLMVWRCAGATATCPAQPPATWAWGGGGGGEGKGEGEGEGEGSEALSRGWNVTFSFLCLTYKEMIVRNGVSQF